jgi:SNF2 family DNA or RNA helicase
MQVKVTNDHIYVKTPYHEKDFVKDVMNGTWSKAEGMYRFPKNIHTLTELARKFPSLMQNTQFMNEGTKLKAARNFFLELKQMNIVLDDRLRPYQNTDVNYLKKLPAAGIFNEPRTGKTPTSIILMKELGSKRNLVICPASLIYNWEKEFERWYPDCEVYVVNGTKLKRKSLYENLKSFGEIRDKSSVLIISKDTLKADIDSPIFGTVFGTCFVDEAHFLRNRDTAQSKAVYAIKADRRYALTGTPTVKHGTDIFGILKFLYPKKFSSYWQFIERYWEMGQDWMGHAEVKDIKPNRKAELQELIGFISVQRKRKDVMKWLPDKQRQTFYCKMEGKQLTHYTEMLEDFMTDDGELDAPNVLTQLMRLRQICLDPRLVGLDAPSAKTKALLEWLDDNKEPVVIMSMFTSYFDLVKKDIEKLGRKVGMIHGKMSNQDKQKSVKLFQAGKIDVLLCNIISAGVGFTLDRAETVLFLDKDWSPSINEQAEDRVTPVSEERNHKHTIISFVASDSVDERIDKVLEEKKSFTDIINNGGMNAIRRLLS